MSRRWWSALLLAGLLAGCAGTPAASPRPASSTVDLAAMRVAAGIADCPGGSAGPAVAGGLPEISLECLGGGSPVRLAGLRGPMLINLWAQWCEPCRAEAAHLAGFAAGQQEVAVLGINYSDPQTALAIEFAQLTRTTYPHLQDQEATIKAALGVPGIPFTLLLDADGRVAAKHPGPFVSREQLQAWVAKGLKDE